MKRFALLLMVATAACGTTVPMQQQVSAARGLAPGQVSVGGAVPASRGGGDPGVTAPTHSDEPQSTSLGTTSAGVRGTASTQPPAVPATGTVRAAGGGYSATQIKIGFAISSDASKALGGFGLGVSVADQKQLVDTWVARVNATGGIAGRRVVPVFYDYSATGNIETQDQEACSTWTQDDRVFAATGVRAGASGSGDNLTPCLAKAGVAWLNAAGDQHKWNSYFRSMYATGTMTRTREERVLVESLARQGFFTSHAKIGVIINDSGENMSRAVDEGMVPALRKLGLSITKRFMETVAESQSTNAELQMFSAGVTHVLFAAPGGAAPSFFMQAAQNQARTYHYGLSSQDAPGLTVQSLAPANQAKNAVGVGYQPGVDVDAHNQPPPTGGMRSCFDYYRSKGFDTGSLNQAAMAIICDGLNLVRAALQGQVNPTLDSFAAGVARLGGSFAAAGTFSTYFGADRHDGPASTRDLAFGTACGCFQYRGPLRPAA